MKVVSWNVNGLRGCIQKGFLDFFNQIDADIFAIQETKLQPDQINLNLPGYIQIWHSGERKGYASTAIFTKLQPLNITYDFEEQTHPKEGRIITVEFDNFFFVNAYVPNSQEGLVRLAYRMQWEQALQTHLIYLDQQKPVIYCGDLNVAHKEIDLHNPKTNHMNPGFSDQERQQMTHLLQLGFIDTFRNLYPEQVAYSWWSYRFHARSKNRGWRIDYFLVSNRLITQVKNSEIHSEIMGSDHCPVILTIEI